MLWYTKQETADLVTFTEEILNGKFHFFCAVLKRSIFKSYKKGILKESSGIEQVID